MNNAKINMGVQITFQYLIFISFWCIHRNGIAGSVLFFLFLRRLRTVFRSGCGRLRPTNNVEEPPFLRTLVTPVTSCLLEDGSHSNVCGGISLRFSCAFSWWFVLCLFSRICWQFGWLPWKKYIYLVPLSIFTRTVCGFLFGLVWFFGIELYEYFMYFEY